MTVPSFYEQWINRYKNEEQLVLYLENTPNAD